MEELQLAAIDELGADFEAAQIDYWVFGGWAVDFHIGRITRPHSDIDIAIWLTDLDRVTLKLEKDGWHAEPDGGAGYRAFTRRQVRAEFAFLERGPEDSIHTPTVQGDAPWPRDAFGAERRAIGETSARVISLSALREEKSSGAGDADTKSKDMIDLAALNAAADLQ